MEMNFCRRCGGALTHQQAHIYKCVNDHTLYANASPAVGIFLVNERDEVLVAIRGIEPGKGRFDSPGGYLDGSETLEQAIAREVQEEIGISPASYDPPQFIMSGIDLYDFAGETVNVVSSMFWARFHTDLKFNAQDDVASVTLIRLIDLNPADFYFPAVRQGAEQLKEMLS